LWEGVIKAIGIIDELTIIIFFPIAVIVIYKNKKSRYWLYFVLLLSLLIMGIVGLVSGMLNGNALMVSMLGIFDYIKYLLVIFIFAAFFKDFTEFKNIFRLVLAVAVFLGLFALLQEIWAVGSHYIFHKDIYDPEIYILRQTPQLFEQGWRFGIYRTASLMYNQNMFGLFSLLILSIYLYTEKKVNSLIFISLISGIIVSVSMMVYTGFALLTALQIIRGRKWLIVFFIPAIIILFNMSNNIRESGGRVSNTVKTDSLTDDKMSPDIVNEISYRRYSINKALEVWKDHPYFGVGPGMFGGTISVQYNSYLYEEYGFNALTYLKQIKGIDQFWPQLLTETGIVGTAFFGAIIISLFVLLYLLRHEKTSFEEKGLLTGLIMYTIVILIYTFGSGLNLSAVLFTYCAFFGMGMGAQDPVC
jgi:hypothetical protein